MYRSTYICLFILFFSKSLLTQEQKPAVSQTLTVGHQSSSPLGIIVLYDASTDDTLQTLASCAQVLADDLGANGQFISSVRAVSQPPKSRREITALLMQDIHIVVLLARESSGSKISYRMYDTTTGRLLPQGGSNYRKQGTKPREWAHHLAGKIWQVITGEKGNFTSRIAYAKEVPHKDGISFKHICVNDHNGGAERVVVSNKTICVAPRWNTHAVHPKLFFSEYTNTNVRLVSIDKYGKQRVISDRDGTTMQLVYAPDGKRCAYAASRGDGACQIYLVDDRELYNITNNEGNNFCPVFNHDGTKIYYCSDDKTGNPHIMCYAIGDKKHSAITGSGYCIGLAYNLVHRQLAYSSRVGNCMQLYIYDESTGMHTQLLHGSGSREEPTWSPCGNQLAYVHEYGQESRIAVYDCRLKKERYITPLGSRCGYPVWSLPQEQPTIFNGMGST